jgi:hypothetical protein
VPGFWLGAWAWDEVAGEYEDAVKEGYAFVAGLAELRNVTYVDLPTSQWPMWSRPRELAAIIRGVAQAHAPGTTARPAVAGSDA